MKSYKPAEGAPLLRTTEGEAFPECGKMIDPANRYYARLISEEALVAVDDVAQPEPETETDKPAAAAGSKRETRK
ncbi:hypothetical protein HPDFL43_05825 [Hoeflea phototrophica DFL-43]|jgi:hypothetical protein|uniref:DUF2635 domain-containing protein n=1 Tax=Hoeflea phototrophica (strain DSM 17068 / NCIMB 14078 / DFL-43) TaxID=411684 RepID=A9D4S2_HOEPD|nr:hypothetical protein [Hoeflea phototrophica]EDQ33948.1 hypothetical protein HPDFL43_05825 [Hoeflea phototrophica DFL-43]